jgi:hypothetical protein
LEVSNAKGSESVRDNGTYKRNCMRQMSKEESEE